METQTLPFDERSVSGFADISASLLSTSSHIGDVKGCFIPGLKELAFESGAMIFWQLLVSDPTDSYILSNYFPTRSHSHSQGLLIMDWWPRS